MNHLREPAAGASAVVVVLYTESAVAIAAENLTGKKKRSAFSLAL